MLFGKLSKTVGEQKGSEMDQSKQVMYESFFRELEEIEKDRMLKVAVALDPSQLQHPLTMEEKAEAMRKVAFNPLAIGNVARTGLGMLKHPATAAKGLKSIFTKGMKGAPAGADTFGKARQGAKALWDTPGGRAAMLGAGGATALGGAAALGRATA